MTAAMAVGLAFLACAPAFGANQTVTATDFIFTPAQVTLTQGETVTWTNGGGNHNVRFDDDSYIMPPMPSTDPWVVSRVFTQPGSFGYYCAIHGAAGGSGMSGTVVVNPAPPGGGGGGGGGGTPGPGPGPGPGANPAPVSALVASSKQDVDKLFVRASMNEAGTLTAAGRVSVPGGAPKVYAFKRASRAVSPGQKVKLRLKLRKKALKAVKRALLRGKKLRARITLTAKDTTGKETRRKRTIRLTR